MKICIVRLSALGDIVMCLPLIRTLLKNFPEAEITWIVGKPFGSILQGLKRVHVIEMPKVKSFRDWIKAKRILEPYRFDILLATQASFSAHLLYLLISAKRKIGYDSFRSKDFHTLFIKERIPFHKEHTVEGFLRFSKMIGASEMCFDGSIPCVAKEEQRESYFVINPCSSKQEKDWDYKNYIPIMDYVKKEFGLTPILTGGKADLPICEEIAKECGCINLCGKTTLPELAALLKGAKFLLSPDTGPAHIASALNTPVIGLFAPTSSLLTGPYFSKQYIIDKHAEVVKRYATPKEAKQGWNIRIYHKEAMSLITIDDVKAKISKVMGQV